MASTLSKTRNAKTKKSNRSTSKSKKDSVISEQTSTSPAIQDVKEINCESQLENREDGSDSSAGIVNKGSEGKDQRSKSVEQVSHKNR